MLVERDQFPERFRRKPLSHDRGGWSIALKGAMWHQPLRCPGGADLFGCSAERKRLRLRQHIRQQQIVVIAHWIQGLGERYKIARNEFRPLVNQLVERVLSIRSWLTPIDGSRLIFDALSLKRYVLAVALHG